MHLLETERLILRRFEEKDGWFGFELNSNPDVLRYTGDKQFEHVEAANAFFKQYNHYHLFNIGRLWTELKENGQLIGWSGLKNNDGIIDLGYRFLQESWGKGYAYEASKAVMIDGFLRMNFDEIVANIHPDNHRSEALARRLHFDWNGEMEDFNAEGFRVFKTNRAAWKNELNGFHLIRTDSSHPDFISLVEQLDKELAVRDGDDHAFYHQFNGISNLSHVSVGFFNQQPVCIGAFKPFDESTVEIKRMYTLPEFRGQGLAVKMLRNLESWSACLGNEFAILETGINQPEAIALYEKTAYIRIPNYGQYAGVNNSVCFSKKL